MDQVATAVPRGGGHALPRRATMGTGLSADKKNGKKTRERSLSLVSMERSR